MDQFLLISFLGPKEAFVPNLIKLTWKCLPVVVVVYMDGQKLGTLCDYTWFSESTILFRVFDQYLVKELQNFLIKDIQNKKDVDVTSVIIIPISN